MITSLRLNNFKSFKEKTINFKKLTILAGSNSVGKSSIIQALLLSRITLEKYTQYNLFTNEAKLDEKKINIPLNGKYALGLGNVAEVLTRDTNAEVIQFDLFDSLNSSGIHLSYNTEDLDAYELISDIPIQKGKFDDLKYEFYYLNAERIGPRLSYSLDQQEFPNVGCQGEYTIQILSSKEPHLLQGKAKRLFEGSVDTKLITQVNLWMDFIIPGFYFSHLESHKSIKIAESKIAKSTPTNVGFGISYVLPIVVNGLIAKEDSVFIVENPEAHLHPSGQSRIGRFLAQVAASGVQLIIETHSEHVINGLRIATLENKISPKDIIINFFHTNNETREIEVDEIEIRETGDLTRFPRDFFDQVQQDMAELYKIKRAQNNG